MKRLLNLLTVLAAFLNLTKGCGHRSSGNAGQRLLRIGAALAARQLSSANAGGTLQGVLGGSSVGGLLGNIRRHSGAGLGSGLVSGTTGLALSGATSGARLTGLGGGLRGGSGGVVLAGLGTLAAETLSSGGSSGGILSGSGLAGSGGSPGVLLGQVLQPPRQVAAAGFITASTATSSSTRVTANLPQHTSGIIVPSPGGGVPQGIPPTVASGPSSRPVDSAGLRGAQGALAGVFATGAGAGSLSGVEAIGTTGLNGGSTSPGSVTVPNNFGPGGSQLQSLGQSAHEIRQAMSTRSLVTSNIVTNSAGGVGTQLAGNTPTNAQGSSFPASGNPGQALQQSFQQAGRTVAGGLSAVGSAVSSATSFGANIVTNTGGNTPRLAAGPGSGLSSGGDLNPVSGSLSSGVPSGGGLRERGAVHDVGIVQGLLGGAAGRPGGGLPGGGPGSGTEPGLVHSASGEGILTRQRLRDGTLAGTIGSGAPALQSTASMVTHTAGSTATTLVNAASSLSGVDVAPGVGIGQNPRVPTSGPESLALQGVGQSSRQREQTFGGGIIGPVRPSLPSTAGITNQIASSSASTSMLNVASNLAGIHGAATPGVGIPQSPGGAVTGMVAGINLGQRLGQGAPEGGQPLEGTFTGSGGATQLSTTSTGTQFSGSFQGGNPGQGPAPGTQPMSQGPGAGSHVTVSASSHSTSTWQARTHVVTGSPASPAGGLPIIPGNGPVVGAPSGGSVFSSTGSSSGTNLLGAIVRASAGGHSVGNPVTTIPSAGLAGPVPNGAGVSGSNGAISGTVRGIAHHGQMQQRRRMGAAAATGIALGTVATALAVGAIGTGIASAIQSSMAAGGRRPGGCSRSGCSGGCGRKRRSVPQYKVPAEVLNNILMDFNRRY